MKDEVKFFEEEEKGKTVIQEENNSLSKVSDFSSLYRERVDLRVESVFVSIFGSEEVK